MNIDSSIVVDEDDLKFQHFVVDVELDVIIIYQSIVAVVVVPKDNVSQVVCKKKIKVFFYEFNVKTQR
ncbi:hypothetical protein DERF_000156 [Dermatophagoides farinae]|uniref:Uncharacterized protein n=1 Tax=Dermatophagoides farinae TaxID=6954 RepID=A0A922I830_DERFA|nr:hypothetical protein DERF_000156 [Dermatophagoides farinae]